MVVLQVLIRCVRINTITPKVSFLSSEMVARCLFFRSSHQSMRRVIYFLEDCIISVQLKVQFSKFLSNDTFEVIVAMCITVTAQLCSG